MIVRPTRYAGVFFRSRTEARWAVFWDRLGIGWEYEPERFELPNGQIYIPDFRICCGEDSTLVEIKPPPSPDFEKAKLLAVPMVLLEGPPGYAPVTLQLVGGESGIPFRARLPFIGSARPRPDWVAAKNFALSERFGS
jgi:hypothetical protein